MEGLTLMPGFKPDVTEALMQQGSLSVVDGAGPAKRGRRGRKDGGQDQVIKVSAINDKLDHLLKLHGSKEEAKEDFSKAVKAVAEGAGVHASVLKRFVVARWGEEFDKARSRSAQLEMLFEEIGG